MKWVTREKARVDRIACPWLITRFVDKEPTFLFVPARDVLAVAKKEDAIPYDVPDVELGHHGDQCSFDAFVDKYKLTDPALRELAPHRARGRHGRAGTHARIGRPVCGGDRVSGLGAGRLRQHEKAVPRVRRAL